MWNICGDESSTWKNTSNFTFNLDRAWGSKFGVKRSSHQPSQLDLDQKYEWLGCIGKRGGCIIGITLKYLIYSVCTCTWFKWLCWGETCVQDRWRHVCRTRTRPELCCDHSPWGIVLHADATQMGKWCDPLEHLITLHATEEFKHGT